MTLTRKQILEIARANMLEYVHETYLTRFVEDILAASTQLIVQECCATLESNGYDDASAQLRKEFDPKASG